MYVLRRKNEFVQIEQKLIFYADSILFSKYLNLFGVCVCVCVLDKLYKTACNCWVIEKKDSAPRALSNIESCFA